MSSLTPSFLLKLSFGCPSLTVTIRKAKACSPCSPFFVYISKPDKHMELNFEGLTIDELLEITP